MSEKRRARVGAGDGAGGGLGVRRPRRSSPAMLALRAGSAVGFGLLEKRDAEVEAGNAALKAGKAEEALAALRQGAEEAAGRRGDALRSRRRALRAVALRRGGTGVLARDRGQGSGAQGLGLLQPGERLLQEGEVQGGGLGLHALARPSSPSDKQAKWNLEIALRKQKDEEKKQQDQKNQDDKNKDDKKKDDKQDKKDRRTRTRKTKTSRTRTSRTRRTRTRARRTSRTGAAEAAAERARGGEADPAGARQPGAELEGPREGAGQGAGGATRAAGARLVIRRSAWPRGFCWPSRRDCDLAAAPCRRPSFNAEIDREAVRARRAVHLPADPVRSPTKRSRVSAARLSRPAGGGGAAVPQPLDQRSRWGGQPFRSRTLTSGPISLLLPAGRQGAAHDRRGARARRRARDWRPTGVQVRVGAAGAQQHPGAAPGIGPQPPFSSCSRRAGDLRSATIARRPTRSRRSPSRRLHPRRPRQDARLRRRAGDGRLVPLRDSRSRTGSDRSRSRTPTGSGRRTSPPPRRRDGCRSTSRADRRAHLQRRAAVQEGAVPARRPAS